LHFASGVNAPVTAVFCSTIPAFGYTPLSDVSIIAEIDYDLSCRPCGLHGLKSCPQKHFKCAFDIKTKTLVQALEKNNAAI
jgi:heptosyltransferase-2